MKRKPKGPPPLIEEKDDRVQLRNFTEYVRAICMSEWEGCCCARPKRHEGLHRCGSVYDTCERWTDAQAEEWWQEFKKDL